MFSEREKVGFAYLTKSPFTEVENDETHSYHRFPSRGKGGETSADTIVGPPPTGAIRALGTAEVTAGSYLTWYVKGMVLLLNL